MHKFTRTSALLGSLNSISISSVAPCRFWKMTDSESSSILSEVCNKTFIHCFQDRRERYTKNKMYCYESCVERLKLAINYIC